MQARHWKPRHHRADVGQRHELVLPDGDGRGGNEDAAGIDAMQIDRFRQA